MSDDDRLSEIEADARAMLDAMISETRTEPSTTLELFARDPLLAEINADARQLLDAMLDEGPPPRAARRLGRRRIGPRRVAAVAVAAAVLGLAGGALANNWLANKREAEHERDLAQARALAEANFGDAQSNIEAPMRYPSGLAPLRSPPRATAEQPAPEAEVKQLRPPGARGPDLATLDAQAYAALRAGRLDEAAALFGQIVKRGGRSEYAELAFGELFALTRRQGGSDKLEKLWRSYLKRFPKGRYADAAQAGLCRRAPANREATCWADYLHDHPRGSARGEALRSTGPE